MPSGTVKWFDSAKGYGFTKPDQGGPDVFVYMRAVEQAGLKSLTNGQKVEYDLIEDMSKGNSAVNLKLI